MTEHEYREPLPMSRTDAKEALRSGDPWRLRETIIRLALHDPDWRWVQGLCLQYLESPDDSVRSVAAISLGHLARIHGTIDRESVVPALERLLDDKEVSGIAGDALDDIGMFASEEN